MDLYRWHRHPDDKTRWCPTGRFDNQSRPQSLYSTYSTTIAIHPCQTTTVEERKVSLRKIWRTLNSGMEHLSITGRRLNRRFVRSFEISSLRSLTKLVLNGNQLYRDKASFRRLLSSLPDNLQDLSLSWNGMDEQLAAVLARRLPCLKKMKSISLCGNSIGPEGVRILVQEGNLHQISSVDLWDCDIGDEGAAVLGKALGFPDTRTERIILDMNGIGDEGMKCLSKGLAKNSVLQALHLYCNEIRDEGVRALVSAMTFREDTCCLAEVSLRANRISPLGAKEIASHLQNTKCLKKLYLSHNSIGDEGVQYFAEALDGKNKGQQLEELTLSYNRLSNKSAFTMAAALVANKRLQVLALDGNLGVDRRGAKHFVQCLQQNKTLVKLQILEKSYENHLLNDKLDFYLEANHRGRKYVGDTSSIPDAAWPRIWSQLKRPDHLFLFLRDQPHIACQRMQQLPAMPFSTHQKLFSTFLIAGNAIKIKPTCLGKS